MIEKRFTFVIDNGEDTIYDLSEKGSILENFIEIEEMLNNLNNENEQLKHDATVLIQANQDYRRENEQLKKILGFLKNDNAEDILNVLNSQENRLWELKQENEQFKQQINKLESQLYCPFDSICIQCTNEYLVQKGEYYVSKCKKGHEQCSKVDVKYCDDFELKGDLV